MESGAQSNVHEMSCNEHTLTCVCCHPHIHIIAVVTMVDVLFRMHTYQYAHYIDESYEDAFVAEQTFFFNSEHRDAVGIGKLYLQ